MKNDRFMGGADWNTVEKFIPKIWNPEKEDVLEEVNNGLIMELRITLLSKEKSSYWKQFSKGLLGKQDIKLLEKINNELLDQDGKNPITSTMYIDQLWNSSKLFLEVQKWSNIKKSSFYDLFEQLNTNYDAVRALIYAQDDLIILLNDLDSDSFNKEHQKTVFKLLLQEVNEKKIQGLTF